ncbi:MAG: diguanylate cyclase [Syntrophales bacterium]|nr:diguanylate cyclase [Syntrophales bacterium]
MTLIFILTLSIILQFIAAFMALRLISLTGRRTAWGLISAALVLMALRRCVTLFHMLSGYATIRLDINTEIIALAISTLMVVGISMITPLFTDRKRAEDALLKSEEKFRIIFDKAIDGILIVDFTTKKILHGNDALCSMLGYTQEEIENLTVHDIHPPKNTSPVLAEFEKRAKGGMCLAEGVPVLKKDGTIFYADINTSRTATGGEHYYVVGIFRDITERKRVEEEMRDMSLRDHLTKLYNRRGFISLAEQQIKVAKREKRQLMLAFVDVDDLKLINDTFGHDEGDGALIGTANVLRNTFREADLKARMGGDEFAILAIDNTDGGTEAFSERLQNTIDNYNAKNSCQYRLSMSWGIAVYDPDSPVDLDTLMSSADKLMYKQKNQKKREKDSIHYSRASLLTI